MWNRCVDCGREFRVEPDETWKKRCFQCWKAWKAEQAGFDEYSVDPLFEKSRQVAILQIQKYQLEQEISELNSLKRELLSRLRRLIGLCHPDKHGGSQTASDVTLWLLGLKDRFGMNVG